MTPRASALFFALCALPAAAGEPITVAASAEAPRSDDALLRAYQKEYAVLEAERRELTRRLSEVKEEGAARKATAERELALLEDDVVAITLLADRADARLADRERADDGLDNGDVLQNIATQAASLLHKDAPDEATPDALAVLLLAAVNEVAQRAAVRREPGVFFDERGNRVEGDLLRVGAVAAFGAAPGAAGALVPAGGGRYKVWPEAGAGVARALIAGERPAHVGMFLYSGDEAVSPSLDKTALEIVQAGGSVAWVIVCLGFLAALLSVARLALLLRRGAGATELLREVPRLVRAGDMNAARRLCQTTPGAMSRVMAVALDNLHVDRETRTDRIDERVLTEMHIIDRFGSMILVFAGVAPLLGLLGTVTGMISTFDAITEFGTGDPRLLSGGISEALITTELGLMVAIPTLLIGNLLSGIGERTKRRLDTGSLAVSNLAEPLEDDEPRPTLRSVDDAA